MNLLYMKGRDYCTLSKSKTILFAAMAAATITLAACTDEDDSIPSSSGTPLQVQVSTAQPKTRALIESTTLPEGSIIGVSLVKTGGGDYGKGYPNVPYTATGTGESQTWAAQAGEITLSSEKGTLYAYYPYSNQITDIKKIPVSTETQTDWLYALPVDEVSDAKPQADIVMNHALSAVRVLVNRGSYTGTGALTEVTLTGEGYATSAMLDGATGELSETKGQGTAQRMTVSQTLDPSVYAQTDFILIPTGQDKPMTVALTVDGRTKTVDIPAWTMQQGYMYKIYLTADESEIEFKDISTDQWSFGDDGSIVIQGDGYKVNVTGNLEGIAFSTQKSQGTVSVKAVPVNYGEYINHPTTQGTAEIVMAEDRKAAIRDITVTDMQSDVDIIFDGTTQYVIRSTHDIAAAGATRVIGSGFTTSKIRYLVVDGQKVEVPADANYTFQQAGTHTVDYIMDSEVNSLAYMFRSVPKVVEVDFSAYNGSKVTSLLSLFESCPTLTRVQAAGTDFTAVTNMKAAFAKCTALTEMDFSGWKLKSVTNIHDLFLQSTALTTVNVKAFETSPLVDFGGAFCKATALKTVTGLNGWNVSNVTVCHGLFNGCSALEDFGDLNNWNTANWTGTEMSGGRYCGIREFFNNCSSLKKIDLHGWDVGKVYNCYAVFNGCTNLETLNITGWTVKSAISLGNMFNACDSLRAVDVSSFDTSNVTNMGAMFKFCRKITQLDVSNFNTSKVTDMGGMFGRCVSLQKLDLSNFDTSNVTDMQQMFLGCGALQELDLSNFDTSNVTNMGQMFYSIGTLKYFDISSFDTSNVTDMGGMFHYVSLAGGKTLDLSHFNTAKVTNMAGMFGMGYHKLNLTGWDTSNVTNMQGMFSYVGVAANPYSIDLSHFNTSKVTNMEGMFQNAVGLSNLNASGWDLSACTNMKSMFGRYEYDGTLLPITVTFTGTINPDVDVTSMFKATKDNGTIRTGYQITLNYPADKAADYAAIIAEVEAVNGTANPIN